MTVLLIYELQVPPGRLAEVAALFQDSYLPAAQRRGMTLEGTFITPPIELDDAPTTLVYRWSLPDAEAVWAMKRQVRDEGITAFWLQVDAIVPSRTRRFFAPYKG